MYARLLAAPGSRLQHFDQHPSIFINTLKSEDLQAAYEFGPFRVETMRRRLLCRGEVIQLRPKAVETLLLLIEQRDRVVGKEELLSRLWPGTVVEEANLTQYIYLLRKTLSNHDGAGEYILTVPGRGYRFVASLRELQGALIGPVHHSTQNDNGVEAVDRQSAEPANCGSSTDGPHDIPQSAWLFLGDYRAWARQPLRLAGAILTISALAVAVVIYLIRGKTDSPTAAAWSHTRLTNTGNVQNVSISPDGNLVTYVVAEGSQQSLRLRQIPSAEEVQIVPPAEVSYGGMTFSPDGLYIYYIVRGKGDAACSLFQISTIGGAVRKLKAGLDSPVSFSPDGASFAFVRESAAQRKSSLMLARTDGSAERELAARQLPEYFDYPAWSPDGKVIACTLINPAVKQRASVVEVQVADGDCRPLSERSWTYATTPQWSSDGRSLFVTTLEGGSGPIWELPYPRGEARPLTNDLTNYLRICLAASGDALVAVEVSELSNLWVVPLADTGPAREIIPGIGRYGGPAWTADGKIVYSSEANGNWDIWLTEADGAGRKQLTSNSYHDTNPSVSPDGRYIVFASDRADRSNIWRMDADGTNLQQLTHGGDDFNPQCTPDGKWVVYNSSSPVGPYAVFKVPIGGGEAVLITSTPCRAPSVSPDGKLIACLSTGESISAQVEPNRIAVIPAEGGGRMRNVGDFLPLMITSHLTRLSWTPDGRAITYVDNRGGHANVWGLPLNGGPAKQLTDFHDGQLLAFDLTRDGRQLVCLRGTTRQDVVLIRNFR